MRDRPNTEQSQNHSAETPQDQEQKPVSTSSDQPPLPAAASVDEPDGDAIIEKAVNIAAAMGLGRTPKARRRVYSIVQTNRNFPRLYLTGGPIAVRRKDLKAWLDGMAQNHTFSGKPIGSNRPSDDEKK